MRLPHRPALLLALLLPAAALGLWGKKSDEERLKGKLNSLKVTLSPEQLGYVATSTQVLTQGSLALCFFGRGAWDKGQVVLGRFLEAAERSGIDEPELHILRAWLECGSETPEKGKARLAALARRDDLSEDTRDDVKHLERACGVADAEGIRKLVGKLRLGTAVVRVAWAHLQRSGLLDELGQGISKVPGNIQVSLGGGGWD